MENYINPFLKYRKNIYSQNGEDGIIQEILKRLNISSGWVCEFGAWDGKYLSNTFFLIERGFRGIYIEGDSQKYNDLVKTSTEYKTINPINKFIEESGDNSLDNILNKTSIPLDFDILSIDIDDKDYLIWKSLEQYNPKIVIIEINSGISPYNETFIASDTNAGTSFFPMLLLGIEKGYKFVCHTGNMIFIRNDIFEKLNENILIFPSFLTNYNF